MARTRRDIAMPRTTSCASLYSDDLSRQLELVSADWLTSMEMVVIGSMTCRRKGWMELFMNHDMAVNINWNSGLNGLYPNFWIFSFISSEFI